MDFNMKQWRDESEEASRCAKLPRLNNPHSSPALPLFVPQPSTTHLPYSSHHSTTTKLPRMGSYFSLAQWQELELQTLVFRHLMAGAAVPPELLHLVKKSLISSPPYYFCNPLHYHPSLFQSGYWGKAAMDPEPGRCRRTDGKKWRCSRDVVVGQKYCERHMHRGRNRSRKPVEIPTSGNGGGGGEAVKASISLSHGMSGADGGSAAPRFSLSVPFTSLDLLHNNRRPMSEKKWAFEVENENGESGGDRRLRHFMDDEAATNLSISRWDFSLKLGSGNGEERGEGERERGEEVISWGMGWESSRMGGPLAEALRSTSSPTSVLHRLQITSASHTSS